MVLTGAYHADIARTAAWNLVWYFNQYLGIPADVGNFTIRNIVSSFHLGFSVSLANLKLALGGRVRFDPDTFPAAIFNSALHAKATALLYESGNGVLTGLKKEEQVKVEYVNVYHVASLFEKGKEDAFRRRKFREMQNRQLRMQASGGGVVTALDGKPGPGPGGRDPEEEMQRAKLRLIQAAYKEVSEKEAKALKRRATAALAALSDDSAVAAEGAIAATPDLEHLARGALDPENDVVMDDLAASLLAGAAVASAHGKDRLADGSLPPEHILQMVIPAQHGGGEAGSVAPMRFETIPVTAADSICYVDAKGFIHVKTHGFGNGPSSAPDEEMPDAPAYVPLSAHLPTVDTPSPAAKRPPSLYSVAPRMQPPNKKTKR